MKFPLKFLNKFPFFVSVILLPVYYFIAYPVAFILNYMDVNISHKAGTGLLVKAWK
jgi:hypothetical protein